VIRLIWAKCLLNIGKLDGSYIQKEAEPILVDVFVQQAQVAMENYGVGPSDWIVIINDAADWAREHLDNELAKIIQPEL